MSGRHIVNAIEPATKADSCPHCCMLAKANDGPMCSLCDQEHAEGSHQLRKRKKQ